jgi:DNA transposition AAA+ family ATPase
MRAEIRKHLAETGKNQTKFQGEIGVSAASYGKFMNGKYKDQWSAVQNGTYEAAGTYLAKYKIQKKN